MLSRILLIVAACGLLFAQPNELNLRQDPPAAIQSNQVNAVYTGTAGGTTYYYWISVRYPIGFSMPVSPVVVARAASSLGGGNSVALTWPAMAGASSYDVLRTSTPAAPSSCTCAVTLATTSTSVTDNGGGLSAWPPAGLTAAGSANMVLQINNRDGDAPYITMAVRNAQRLLGYELGVLKNGPTPGYVPPNFIQTYSNQYGRLSCVDGNGGSCLSNPVLPAKSIYDFVYSGNGVVIGEVNIGDGASHPLSASFSSLSAARAYYPFADLTWEMASAALEKCRIAESSCYAPAGTYLVNKQFATGTLTSADQLKRGWSLIGQGMYATVFKVTAAIDWLVVADYNQRFSEFTIDGNTTALSNIVFFRSANAKLERVRSFHATYGAKVDTGFASPAGQSSFLKLYDSFFTDNTEYGLYWPTFQEEAHAPELINTQMNDNGKSGLLFKGYGCRIIGGGFQNNTEYGIVLGADADADSTRECGIFYPWLEFNTAGGAYSSAKAAGNDWYLHTLLQGVSRNAASQDIVNTVHHASLLAVGSGGLKIESGAGNRGVMFHGNASGANGHIRAYAADDTNANLQLHGKGTGAVAINCGTGASDTARILSSSGDIIGYVDCSANPGFFIRSGASDPLVKMQSVGGGPAIVGTATNHSLELRANNTNVLELMQDKKMKSAGNTFSTLGTPADGNFIWCADCNVATPCTGAGTGAWAFRSNSSWKCPF